MSDTIIMPAAGTPISGGKTMRGKQDMSSADGTSSVGFLGTLVSTLQKRENDESVKAGRFFDKRQERVTDTSLQEKNSPLENSPQAGIAHTGHGDSAAPAVKEVGDDAHSDSTRDADKKTTESGSTALQEQANDMSSLSSKAKAETVIALWKRLSHQTTKNCADKTVFADDSSSMKKFADVRSAGDHSLQKSAVKEGKAPITGVLPADEKDSGIMTAKGGTGRMSGRGNILSQTATVDAPGKNGNGAVSHASGMGNAHAVTRHAHGLTLDATTKDRSSADESAGKTDGKSEGFNGLNKGKTAETLLKDVGGNSKGNEAPRNASTGQKSGYVASDSKETSVTQNGMDGTQAKSGVDRATPRGHNHAAPQEKVNTASSASQGMEGETQGARVAKVASHEATEKGDFVKEMKGRFQVPENNGEKTAADGASPRQQGSVRGAGQRGNAHQPVSATGAESRQSDGDRSGMFDMTQRGEDTGSKGTRESAFPQESRLTSPEKTRVSPVLEDSSVSHTEKTSGVVTARNDNAGTMVKESSVVRHVVDHTLLLVHRNGGRVQLNLHPSQLGSLNLAVQVKGDKLRVIITADRANVHHALEANIDKLRESLAVSGIDKNDIDISVEHRKSGDQPDGGSTGGRFADLQGRDNGHGRETHSGHDVSSMDSVAAEDFTKREHGGRRVDGSISVFA